MDVVMVRVCTLDGHVLLISALEVLKKSPVMFSALRSPFLWIRSVVQGEFTKLP